MDDNDEYFDEETGEVMSHGTTENNNQGGSSHEESAQNIPDENGNENGNDGGHSVATRSTGSSASLGDTGLVETDADVGLSNPSRELSPDTSGTAGARVQSTPNVDSVANVAGERHFRVQKSSQSTGTCRGRRLNPRVTFTPASADESRDSNTTDARSYSPFSGSETNAGKQAVGADHSEQHPPHVIRVSDASYSEDVLIQYGVDPYRWMYPKDLSRPDKPQSPVPSHSENELSDSELLTQLCWHTGKGPIGGQGRPRRTGHGREETEAGLQQPEDENVCVSDDGSVGHSNPSKAAVTNTERFHVPSEFKKIGESCDGKSSVGETFEVCAGKGGLAGRRAGMMSRNESWESETGEGKVTGGVDGAGLVHHQAGAVGPDSGGACDNDTFSGRTNEKVDGEFGQSVDSSESASGMTCPCPQCGREMRYGASDGWANPPNGQQRQGNENMCNCDHSDKGPEWQAMLMMKMFKMMKVMKMQSTMSRGGHRPFSLSQAQRLPSPRQPSWNQSRGREGCPMFRGTNTGGALGPPGNVRMFCSSWYRPPGGSGESCARGGENPKDLPGAGAC